MPAPRHIDVRWNGVFGTAAAPVEIWSMGVSLIPSSTADGTFTPSLATMSSLATALSNSWTSLIVGVASPAILTETKCSLVNSSGFVEKDANGAYVQGVSGRVQAGSGVLRYPFQVALVHTLETAASGATGRGRFYLPAPDAGTPGADGLMADVTRDGFVTRAKTFLDDVNAQAALLSIGRVCVASGGSAVKNIPSALRPVTHIAVGRVLDTQRRRRNDLPETRERAALA